jgi:hypothetical protein
MDMGPFGSKFGCGNLYKQSALRIDVFKKCQQQKNMPLN